MILERKAIRPMKYINEELKTIDHTYRPIPFWSWNDKLEEGELKRQIQWMYDNGIGGFFMHARGGLKTPYLSEEWMGAIKTCCEEAQKLGMDAWAYDENGWPSGFAGGKLLENEENRDMYIEYSHGSFDPAADVSYIMTDTELLRAEGENEAGEYLNLYLRRSASTVDILNPNVVKQFLQITHEQYRARFGADFSKKIAGFFTDEPQYYRWGTSYTPLLVEYFRNHYGEDLFDQLGLLFVEKEGYRTFRYRYWLAMQKLMLNSFAKQIYDWCCDNGVRFTGHYVEEASLAGQLMCCAGIMPFYEYEHIPGIDWLGGDSNNELAPRQLGSAARQLGKKQTLSETFGCCGWNISPADLKRIAGFQYACGVNLMCHHLIPYSEHGQRKKDYPAHFNPINPWIGEHFREFNDYFSKLGFLLSESEEPVNVAMLHPIRSAYFDYKRGDNTGRPPASEVDKPLLDACRQLSSQGIAYHFLDETLLEKHGFVDGASIGCGKCSYTYLVIPKIMTMGKYTEQLLRQFITNGGKVLLLDEKPSYLEGDPYTYEYLQSNSSIEEIVGEQPFSVENKNTNLYCTYHVFRGKPFIFVQNASSEEGYRQTFRFADNTASFVAYDPVTSETKQVPLTVRLGKNEGVLLFPSTDPAPAEKELETVAVRFENAAVQFETNYLTLDAVRYSKDGLQYSDHILCCDLYKQLLCERYEGKLWLRYEFDVQTIPNKLSILTEKSDSIDHRINGHEITFDRVLKEEPCVQIADIAKYIQKGINNYETSLDWHQSEETYYALFGEGVTESLRNCIAYDSEIEPVYLAGMFGVYSYENFEDFDERFILGHSFYIGDVPTKVTSVVKDGFPYFRGALTVSQTVHFAHNDIRLVLPGDYLTAKIWVNGTYAGELCYQEGLDISSVARAGENEIKVIFSIGNRNLLGPLHAKDNECSVGPHLFEKNDLPKGADGSVMYKFRRFYVR